MAAAAEGFAREAVTSNDFEKSDIQHIRQAVEAEKVTTDPVVIRPTY